MLFFFWLPFEDRNERWALLFAASISILVTIYLTTRLDIDRSHGYIFLILGGLAGLLVPLVAVLLMVLKNSLHGHAVPDFTIPMVASVLQRIPIWVIAGFLVGLGVAVWRGWGTKRS